MQTFTSAVFVTCIAVLSGCSYIPFAGGALDGKLTPNPEDWRTLADVPIVQLETQPQDPYSVKLWVVMEASHLYVFAGDNHSQWAQNLEAEPNVRVKIGDNLYELAAARVTDQQEFQHFAQAWLAKYNSDRTDVKAVDNYLYRLTSRDKSSSAT